MSRPLVIIHGWSDTYESFLNLGEFFVSRLGREVVRIELADWLSMHDEVTYKDLAQAMESAWVSEQLPRKSRSVDVVLHSAGALVFREWLTRFYTYDNNPIDHLLMLAPANFGSHLAHKGRAFYGRIIKGWGHGFRTGKHLLNGLELGSPYTWELAEKDVFCENAWYGQDAIKATVLVGNKGNSGVRAAANESGGDGVVRISSANLNARKMIVDFSSHSQSPKLNFIQPAENHQIAFGILDGENHESLIMKSENTPNNKEVLNLYIQALQVTSEGWAVWNQKLINICSGIDKERAYQNTLVRVVDHVENPVEDYFIEFFDDDPEDGHLAGLFYQKILQKVHVPKSAPHYRSMYCNASQLHDGFNNKECDKLDISIRAEPIIEQNSNVIQVGYNDNVGKVSLDSDTVRFAFAKHTTILVELIIKRELMNAFVIRNL